jgi:hypothetical protein
MKYFFPDSHDLIDPSFDFETERRSPTRIRQRDDLYPHEVYSSPPYNGVLISKAIVEGPGGRYTLAQRHRLYREGGRRFLRLDNFKDKNELKTMGDCGAFSYVREEVPPFSVDEVIDFYEECGFDYGISVDHIILGYKENLDRNLFDLDAVPLEWRRRQEITLELADKFLRRHHERHCKFHPVGVAQGWSPKSYAFSVKELQKMGYRLIALGGLVPLKTVDILSCLENVHEIRHPETSLHLLGITRLENINNFARFGVVSFDSTTPLLQAFKDFKDNYYTFNRTYSAIKVPQVELNNNLKNLIKSGKVKQEYAVRLEKNCLELLKKYDKNDASLENLLEVLREYEELYDGKNNRIEAYREVLTDQPWRACKCAICRQLGIHVVIFRGADRNRRRGFHNIFIFYNRLRRDLG